MAFRTIQTSMFTIQGETGDGMIEAGASPAFGGVTRTTVGAELPVVIVIFSMTGITIRRRSFVPIGMTRLTWSAGMFTDQREPGHGVIEGGASPTLGGVARTTVGTELSIVIVIFRVTGKTIRRRTFIAVGMTGFALNIAMLPGQRKACIGMVKRHIGPFCGLMAGSTVGAKLSVMIVILGMTGIAIGGSTFVGIVHMTGGAGHLRMRASQLEPRGRMIKMNIAPFCRFVTTGAICTKLTVVMVIFRVTGETIRWRTTIDSIGMAIGARQAAVTAVQRKARERMIKVDILPVAGIMAIGAIPSHLPGMRIFMTGSAIHGRALEQEIRMATLTGNTDMFSDQMEDRLGVVKVHIFPGGGLMAGLACLPEQPLMGIVSLMAGETIHGCAFEQIVGMAITASHIDVCRRQFKDRTVMIKVDCLPIFRSMAGCTILA